MEVLQTGMALKVMALSLETHIKIRQVPVCNPSLHKVFDREMSKQVGTTRKFHSLPWSVLKHLSPVSDAEERLGRRCIIGGNVAAGSSSFLSVGL